MHSIELIKIRMTKKQKQEKRVYMKV